MNYRKKIAVYLCLTPVLFAAAIFLLCEFRFAWGTLVAILVFFSASLFRAYRELYLPLVMRSRFLSDALQEERLETILQSDEWKSMDDGDALGAVFRHLLDDAVKQKSAQVDEQQAQLLALQSQINSHFLYNTLECIRGQAMLEGNTEIADMLETLSCFYRYNVNRKESVVTLQDEITNSLNYMKIQQYRFEGRFVMDLRIDKADDSVRECFVPKLMLQPIIENSVLHAFENRKRGVVTLSVAAADDLLIVTLSDDGEGMDSKRLGELVDNIRNGMPSSSNAGVALVNVEKRIKMLFGPEFGLDVYSTAGLGTDVEITLPRVISKD